MTLMHRLRSSFARHVIHLALAATLSVGLATNAYAGKDDKKGEQEPEVIELTGVAAFDDVFARVQAIDERLAAAEDLLKSAKRDLVVALELPQGTPLKDGIADLQAKADGKIAVAMKGKQPKLEATDAVPENVQTAIDAVNRLTDGITTSVDELMAIPGEATALVEESKGFPEKLKAELEADPTASLTKAPKILGTLKSNATITAGLPDRSTKVVTRMTDMVEVVRTAFPLAAGSEGGGEQVADDATLEAGAEPEADAPPDATEGDVADKQSGQAPGTRERRGGKQ